MFWTPNACVVDVLEAFVILTNKSRFSKGDKIHNFSLPTFYVL